MRKDAKCIRNAYRGNHWLSGGITNNSISDYQLPAGITLIALVVTIIVLLILAGIAISLSVGNNGLFSRAKNAVDIWKNAESDEQEKMKNFANTYDEILNNIGSNEDIEENKITIDKITGLEKENTETTDKEGNRVVVPAGFKVVNPDQTVNEGIVIEDVSAENTDTIGNQFVWIPCTIDGANNTLKYDRYAFNSDGYDASQIKLEEKDEDGSYKIRRVDITSYYFHEAMTEQERISIERYGGYYIGRYEAGCDIERSESNKGNIENVARIKENLKVYNWITRDEAKTISERIYIGKSKLCSSYAWNTALKFIDGETGTYAVNSVGGNYKENGGLKNTGYHALKNIYDMGGNVYEWTTESYTDQSTPYVVGGGCYYNQASITPAGNRLYFSSDHLKDNIRN